MRKKYWTPDNWLELRLCKYIAMGVFTMGTKLFSKLQDTDGEWKRQVLVPAPSNMHRTRQDQVFGPINVPSPFRDPNQIAEAQTSLLADHDIEVSEDGKSANIDIFKATSRAFRHARDNNNYIPPSSQRGARKMILCDGVTFYRMGRMATRFGSRVLGLRRWHNAKYYFSNMSLYLNGDHYPELVKYLGGIYDRVNAGLRTTPRGVDELGNAQFVSALFTIEVRCGAAEGDVTECEWVEGGDATAGNVIAGLDPPPVSKVAATTANHGVLIGLIAPHAPPPPNARFSDLRSWRTSCHRVALRVRSTRVPPTAAGSRFPPRAWLQRKFARRA